MSPSSTDDVATHSTPLWRDRADFIIVARIADSDGTAPKKREQLWARRIDDARFEICCIPFFLYDLALGDEVVTTTTEDGQAYVVDRVVKPSGHVTFRVWFGQSTLPTAKQEAVERATALGVAQEWSSENLLALDAPNAEIAKAMATYLQEQEQRGAWVYEAGQSA